MAYCGPKALPLSQFLTWDQADQDAALTWQAYEAARCPGCGSHPDEPAKHFHVDVCPTCVQLDHARESEDAKVRGAHIASAHGAKGKCDRCIGEMKANRKRG